MSDEGRDLARSLAAWMAPRLAERSGAPVAEVAVTDLRRPGAGQSNDTWLFRAIWRADGAPVGDRFVLRRQPSGNRLFHDADVVREGRVLQALHGGSPVPVPEVVAVEAGADVLGSPFFVMRHVDGEVPLARPSIHAVGWLTTLPADRRERLWSSAMDALVAVHRTDWARTHPFLLRGAATDALATHLDRIAQLYRWTTQGREYPITDHALEHLGTAVRSVDAAAPVLVWGDARVGNMIFAPAEADPAQPVVAAVIDWELAAIGPAGIDLGHWLFFDEFATEACGVARLAGWPDRETTIREYERRSGRPVPGIEVFEMMEALFIATTLIRQADLRVERGLAPPDTRMGHDNAVTRSLARRLGLALPPLSPDYLAHRGFTVAAGH